MPRSITGWSGFVVSLLVTATAVAAMPGPSAAAGSAPGGASPAPAAVRHSWSAGLPVTSALSSPVKHLCDRPTEPGQMACFALERTDVRSRMGLAQAAPTGLSPADLQSAYALPSSTAGAGQTVAVVDAYDDPSAEADLAVYRAQYHLPPCTSASGCFRKVDQHGRSGPMPAPDPGWAGEITLDIDMISAVCPQCSILLVEADTPADADLMTAVRTALASKAKFLSLSWGGNETANVVYSDANILHQPGVAIAASSGDYGYGVSYPASSPYVTAVGGTSLKRTTAGRGWAETAWADAGSGCAAYAGKPTFQHDKLCPGRTEADVSAVADPDTGVAIYRTYGDDGWNVAGGTSASAPIIAGVYALAGTPAPGSAPNSFPYLKPAALHDVTSGANGDCGKTALCSAGRRYDGPTGLGTPDGVAGFGLLGAGTITGRLTGAGGKPVGDATVAAGPASARTDPSGRYRIDIPAGTYDLTVSGWGYRTHRERVTVAANRTSIVGFAVSPARKVTLTGRLLDGSGHGWPLAGRVTVVATPGGPRPGGAVWTDPVTGRYRITAYEGAVLRVFADARGTGGYLPASAAITIGAHNASRDVRMTVDSGCFAPGYLWGDKGCAAVPGGLVEGYLRDSSTGAALDGAYVSYSAKTANRSLPSGPTIFDALPTASGFYQMFLPAGSYRFTGTRAAYAKRTASAAIRRNAVTRADFRLDAARLAVSTSAISRAVTPGGHATATFTVRNTGRASTTLSAVERADVAAPSPAQPSAVQLLSAVGVSRRPGAAGTRPLTPVAAGSRPQAAASGWRSIPDYPYPVASSAAATDGGRLYVVGGQVYGGLILDAGAEYDPAAGAWGPLPPMSIPRMGPAAGFIGGRLYVAGGFDGTNGLAGAEVYDPATRTRSPSVAAPEPLLPVASSVVAGQLVVVSCTDLACASAPRSYSFQPSTGRWKRLADYPITAGGMGCGGVSGKLYCAGGFTTDTVADAYSLDLSTGNWSKLPDMPTGLAWAASFAADNKLVISGGVTDSPVNFTFGYDPAKRTWSKLPDSPLYQIEGTGACGGYVVGGHGLHTADTRPAVAQLQGYERCGTEGDSDVPWLAAKGTPAVLKPGQSARITVDLDATGQTGGVYTATLALNADTPYPVSPVTVRMAVSGSR
jgi:hypothetical protein